MVDITIPAVGVAMTEATVLDWLKQPGQPVAEGEAIVEIETDKATTELTSPVDGRLGEHLVAVGDEVAIGTVVVRVLEGDESEAPSETAPVATMPAAAAQRPAPASDGAVASPGGPSRQSPRARRLAMQQEALGVPASAQPDDRFRRIIAAKTLEAWQTVPHFTATRELDAERLLAALDAARARGGEPRPTITDLLLRALARALAAVGDDGEIALAVATERGVLNPVIAGVRTLPLTALTAARAGAVGRARGGRLGEADVAQATTTLSNLGTAAVDTFTGVITPGQRTLLTVGSIAVRPWVDDGALTARSTFHATINADHRVLDGADAAALLDAFAAAVTDARAVLSVEEAA
jgi:pyruvate dehydrogenase E2 component (dihydrolipoamide acetyltransferase)